ncbi:MAG TPA: hypothetical protein VGP18_06180 [Solirubrobacteraceae bacterium]|jgi:hypothetical protein|nr:hypothetical protein [Solirubrobacteraceae bacterium]
MCAQEVNVDGVQSSDKQADEKRGRVAWFLFGVRYALPVAAVIAGVIVMSLGSEADMEGGAGIIGAGFAIYAINWLYRAAFEGDRVERAREEAARAYLAKHGHWPDEAPRSKGRGGKLGRPS